jgi:DNA modification methylase
MSVLDVLAGRARWALAQGDVIDVLAGLPDESIHCVVTSPPYFGLRDYGTARWEGGDPICGHIAFDKPRNDTTNGNRGGHFDTGTRGTQPAKQYRQQYRDTCGKCGATRVDRQIGLEPTPDAFVARMVAVFREVRRVLRRDGTCWINLGDSYAGSWGAQSRPTTTDPGQLDGGSMLSARQIAAHPKGQTGTSSLKNTPGLKPKDLMGVPWRVALALQADGWWLRSDIIWGKSNPMPESVTDRPTRSHEYLFLLTKAARYHYDADAIREPHATEPHAPGNTGKRFDPDGASNGHHWNAERMTEVWGNPAGRNKRSVWTIATEPYPDAHFATYPTELVRPCVLAGCPAGGVVLDPFVGSGTTVLVALRHGRRAIGVDLNSKYLEMASRRIVGDAPLFNQEAAE